MSLLKSKYCTPWGIVFARIQRPEIGRAFCCYNKEICEYYNEQNQMCMGITVECTFGNKVVRSNIYGFCSYLNRNKSSFIYAPKKTI